MHPSRPSPRAPFPSLLLLCAAVGLAGCATVRPADGEAAGRTAQEDAQAIVGQDGSAERFQHLLREMAIHQAGQTPEPRNALPAVEAFWREQAPWTEMRERLAQRLTQELPASDLATLRAALDSPQAHLALAHARRMEQWLGEETYALAEEKASKFEHRMQELREALAAGAVPGLSPAEDYAAALQAARTGDTAAQAVVGEKLLAGNGVRRDPVQAVDWLGRAAAAGYAPAQDTLASLHYRGIGVPRNFRRARELFEQAATHNFLPAVNNLAWLLATCPEPALRDGKRAVALLLPLMDQSPQMLDTLAAAYAESGDYTAAQQTQRQAISGIGSTQDPRLPAFLDRLQSYAGGRPWRDPPR